MLQLIRIEIKLPSGETRDGIFFGPALTSPEEYNEIKNSTVGTIITGMNIAPPADPAEALKDDPDWQEKVDILNNLKKDMEESRDIFDKNNGTS